VTINSGYHYFVNKLIVFCRIAPFCTDFEAEYPTWAKKKSLVQLLCCSVLVRWQCLCVTGGVSEDIFGTIAALAVPGHRGRLMVGQLAGSQLLAEVLAASRVRVLTPTAEPVYFC